MSFWVCACRPRPISFKSILKYLIIHNRIELNLFFFLCLCVQNDMIYLNMKQISKWNEDHQLCFSYFDRSIRHITYILTEFVEKNTLSVGCKPIKKHYWQFCVEMMQIKRPASFHFYELRYSILFKLVQRMGNVVVVLFGFSLFLSDTKLFDYDGSDDGRRQNRFGMNRIYCVSEQKRSDNNGSWIELVDVCVCVSPTIKNLWEIVRFLYGEAWRR